MGTSRKSSDGVIYHSDDHGNYTGTSRPTLGGRYVDYDKDGNVVGHTSEFGGSLVHYDKDGNITGRSIKGLSENSYYHTDNSPHIVDACYVATCVYGSYDCPHMDPAALSGRYAKKHALWPGLHPHLLRRQPHSGPPLWKLPLVPDNVARHPG